MTNRLTRRLDNLEPKRNVRPMVIRRLPGETTEECLARCKPRHPVAILPDKCASVEEWTAEVEAWQHEQNPKKEPIQ